MRSAWLVILVAIFVGCVSPLPPAPVPAPVPAPLPAPGPPTPQPSPAPGVWDFSQVSAIAKRADKRVLREYQAGWDGLAWALERGDVIECPVVATTGELKALIERFEPLAWKGTSVVGFAPGISPAINQALIRGLGADDRPLTKGEAAAAVRRLAEALK